MWNGNFRTVEEYAHKQAVLAEHCRAVGRDPSSIAHTLYIFVDLSDAQQAAGQYPGMHLLHGTPAQVAAELRDYIGLGLQHIMLRFTDFPSTTGLERFTKEVLPALGLA
jgi:alkanesulfonate monooxygenase SsuD/methylene tetrahydromethanopterin reductase-like flavin-dependent oxidoreductase (luciferase family)